MRIVKSLRRSAKKRESIALYASGVAVCILCLLLILSPCSGQEFVREWGGFGTGEGEFNGPTGIVVSGDRVYVLDSGNSRVQCFELWSGAFLSQWGTPGSGDGEFSQPVRIDMHSGHYHVYVADTGIFRVQELSLGGIYLLEWRSEGGGPGEFRVPR